MEWCDWMAMARFLAQRESLKALWRQRNEYAKKAGSGGCQIPLEAALHVEASTCGDDHPGVGCSVHC